MNIDKILNPIEGSGSGGAGRGGGADRGRGGGGNQGFDRNVCHLCGRRFTQPGDVKKHISTVHLKRKDFQCKICGKKFGENGKLK